MFTRCPACHTVHPVNAALLAQADGKVRCGKCHKVSNALENLFDEWPQASAQRPKPGGLPELGNALGSAHLAGARGHAAGDLEDAEDDDPLGVRKRESGPWATARKILVPALWITSSLVLAVVIAFNVAEFMGKPLQDMPQLHSTLLALGLKEEEKQTEFRDIELIELISREMKPHPSRPGVLLLTATVVNRAELPQVYPKVDVTLVDIRGKRLARKLFSPGDYLKRSSELRDGMAPNAYLTFSIDMIDPGEEAAGFEMLFK